MKIIKRLCARVGIYGSLGDKTLRSNNNNNFKELSKDWLMLILIQFLEAKLELIKFIMKRIPEEIAGLRFGSEWCQTLIFHQKLNLYHSEILITASLTWVEKIL